MPERNIVHVMTAGGNYGQSWAQGASSPLPHTRHSLATLASQKTTAADGSDPPKPFVSLMRHAIAPRDSRSDVLPAASAIRQHLRRRRRHCQKRATDIATSAGDINQSLIRTQAIYIGLVRG